MRLLKNQATFKVLTPQLMLDVQNQIIEEAGRTSYQSERGAITPATSAIFIQKLLHDHHDSVIEHSILTVKFYGCSRGLTHELIRHRLASFTQASTRYVDNKDLICIAPPHQATEDPVLLANGKLLSFREMLADAESNYRALREAGWPAEDARQVLPIATEAEIVMSANYREWRHVFELRCARVAHWEIRSVMVALLNALQIMVPVVFADFVYAGVDKHGLAYYALQGVK